MVTCLPMSPKLRCQAYFGGCRRSAGIQLCLSVAFTEGELKQQFQEQNRETDSVSLFYSYSPRTFHDATHPLRKHTHVIYRDFFALKK